MPMTKLSKHEIDYLLKNGIIEPSSSSWRAQVLIVNDGRHKKRLVIDYSRTTKLRMRAMKRSGNAVYNYHNFLNCWKPILRLLTFASLMEKSRAFRSKTYLHVHLLICPLVHPSKLLQIMYCYGANSQSQNPSTLKTRNTFSATAVAPTNSANMMRATKVDREPPQARNAALIVKQARHIPLHPPLLKETYTVETSKQRITNIKRGQ